MAAGPSSSMQRDQEEATRDRSRSPRSEGTQPDPNFVARGRVPQTPHNVLNEEQEAFRRGMETWMRDRNVRIIPAPASDDLRAAAHVHQDTHVTVNIHIHGSSVPPANTASSASASAAPKPAAGENREAAHHDRLVISECQTGLFYFGLFGG